MSAGWCGGWIDCVLPWVATHIMRGLSAWLGKGVEHIEKGVLSTALD